MTANTKYYDISLDSPVTFAGGEIESVPLPLSSVLQASIAFDPVGGSLEFSRELAAQPNQDLRALLFRVVLADLSAAELELMAETPEGIDVFQQIAGIQSGALRTSLENERCRIELACKDTGRDSIYASEGRTLARSLADAMLWDLAGDNTSMARRIDVVLDQIVIASDRDPVVAGAITAALLDGMRYDILTNSDRHEMASRILELFAAGTMGDLSATSFGREALARAFEITEPAPTNVIELGSGADSADDFPEAA